ncbi:MAG: DUF58 domain-containing protein [Actinomycetia bacterium]|nr:DUF58 domain-containing protein [Actinomycetes bacterium]
MTALGRFMATIGVGSWFVGWMTGWTELMVIAAGSLLALMVAVPFVTGRLRLDTSRALIPDRVTVGSGARTEITIYNPGRTPSRSTVLEDRVGPDRHPVPVPVLAPSGNHQGGYDLPTGRRGVFGVGPLVAVRQDPLRLLRREVEQARTDTFFVHPRVVATRPLPLGFAKDLEGPTSDASPTGDVAFHTLRDYQMGDNFRHIHWLSTARTGTTMVRHYVDNRRPTLAVVLDDRAADLDGDQFETAVEATASLAVSSLAARQPVSVAFGGMSLRSPARAGSRTDLLDRLAGVQPGPGTGLLEASVEALRHDPEASALAIVTGPTSAVELARLAAHLRRRVRIIVIRVWPDRNGLDQVGIPGATVLDISDHRQFQAAWNRFAS